MTLHFSRNNAKLTKDELTFSLPSGYSCPAALLCKSTAHRKTGKVSDGKHTQYRCFSASSEARNPNLRRKLWDNYEALIEASTTHKMASLIIDSLQDWAFDRLRIHVAGDYFNENYFLAWRRVAKTFPNKIFYAYTKQIPYIVKYGQKSNNHINVASYGGKHDSLIDHHNLVSASVVYSKEEAAQKGLPIDHDDSHAVSCDQSFALLLHGTQPAKSEASKAVMLLRKQGFSGYSIKTGNTHDLSGKT